MSSEKEETTLGNDVAKMMVFCALTLGVVTYTFNLFKPYMSCVAVQVPIEPVLTPRDRAPS